MAGLVQQGQASVREDKALTDIFELIQAGEITYTDTRLHPFNINRISIRISDDGLEENLVCHYCEAMPYLYAGFLKRL